MSHTHAHSGVMPDPTLVNLGHGFHAYVQLDGSWGLNNAGIFVGERAVTLIDTTFTEPRGQALRSAVTASGPICVTRLARAMASRAQTPTHKPWQQ